MSQLIFGFSRFGFSIMVASLPMFAQDRGKEPVQVSNTEQVNFAPGGVLRLNTPSSNLMVDAWDRPEVEITTIKTTRGSFKSDRQEEGKQCLAGVQTAVDRRSDTELAVTTMVPSRSFFARLFGSKCGAAVELQVHAPRDAKLIISHKAGYVSVSRMTGEIEATSKSGDIVVMLPDPGPYSIDALTEIGTVISDFAGSHGSNVMGQQFRSTNQGPSPRIYLRMGLGGIAIKEVPSTPEAPEPAAGQ